MKRASMKLKLHKGATCIEVTNVAGINSKEHPEQVIEAIQKTDIINTAPDLIYSCHEL